MTEPTFAIHSGPAAQARLRRRYARERRFKLMCLGALGVSDDTPVAAMWRNGRALRIADGPDEVHKMVIARRELKRFRD